MARRRVPTIDDLRVKLCYICREEERFDAQAEPPRAWTHPCSCTLVAHEACLLHWIHTSQQSQARAPNALRCPQCGKPYELESKRPLVLRLLDAANEGLSILGWVATVGGVSLVLFSFGTSVYIISTAYGAYALKEYLGEELFDLLLTDDPSNWPWHSFINLPLIPIGLILSRLSFMSASSTLVPVMLSWPATPPVVRGDRIVLDRWLSKDHPAVSTNDALPLISNWPPSPLFLWLFIFPVTSELYSRLFAQFSHWVLKTTPGRRLSPFQHVMLALNDGGPFGIRVGVEIEERNEDGRREVAQAADAAGDANPNAEQGQDDAAAAAENTISFSGSSLARLIGGALILPRISSLMGSLLFRLSKYSTVLKRILAVRPPLPRGLVPPPLGSTWNDGATLPPFKQIGHAAYTFLRLTCQGTYTWTECDPVWWRNTLGLGLFMVAKDCLHLLHLWLTKRELESRHVKNKSFEGVDVRELDLIDPSAWT